METDWSGVESLFVCGFLRKTFSLLRARVARLLIFSGQFLLLMKVDVVGGTESYCYDKIRNNKFKTREKKKAQ